MAYLFMIFSYVIYDIDVFENDIFCVYIVSKLYIFKRYIFQYKYIFRSTCPRLTFFQPSGVLFIGEECILRDYFLDHS